MKKQILSGILSLGLAVSMLPPVMADDTTSFDFSWNFNENVDTPEHANPTNKALANIWSGNQPGASGASGDYGLAWKTGVGKVAGDGTLNKYANGYSFLSDYFAENSYTDAEFVVGLDFKYYTDHMVAYVAGVKMVVGSYDEYVLPVMLELDGTLSMNGQKIGKTFPEEWNHIDIKYTLSSENGLSADVYLNGALKLSGINDKNAKGAVRSIATAFSAKSDETLLSKEWYYPDSRDEIFCIDNLYIGEDMTKINYGLQIASVRENLSKKQVRVEFTNSVDASKVLLTSLSQNGTAVTVTSSEWEDDKTLLLNLDASLALGTTYTVYLLMEDNTQMQKDFTTSYEFFEDFNSGSSTLLEAGPRGATSVRLGAGRYNTDETDKSYGISSRNGKGGAVTEINKYSGGYAVLVNKYNYGTQKIHHLNYDFKVENPDVWGRILGFLGNSFGDCSWGIFVNTDQTVTLNQTGAESQTLIGTAALNQWHNLDVKIYEYPSNYSWRYWYCRISLDGAEPIIADLGQCRGVYALAFNVAANSVLDESSPERPTERNEVIYLDNLYVGSRNYTDYTNSAFTTSLSNNAGAATATINAGMNPNVGCAILAHYSGATLKNVKVVDFDLEAMTKTQISGTFADYNAETDTVKLLAWDSMTGLKPMTEVQ